MAKISCFAFTSFFFLKNKKWLPSLFYYFPTLYDIIF